jgi:hypothetical protein
VVRAFVLLTALGAVSSPAPLSTNEKVFLDSVDGTLVIDVRGGEIRIRSAHGGPNHRDYAVVDGQSYRIDWGAIRERKRQTDAERRLAVDGDSLRFDGKLVQLPKGTKMRLVWQAVDWNDVVICLGRTSLTDDVAHQVPPFFATELVAFKKSDLRAIVRYLSFDPPTKDEIKILRAVE